MHTLFWAQLRILAEFINRIWGPLHLPLSCPRFCLDFPGAVVAPNSGFLIFQTRKKKKPVNLLLWFYVSHKICLLSGSSLENGNLLGAIPTFIKNIKKKLLLSSVNYIYIAVQKTSRTFHFVRLKVLYS